MQYAFSKQSVWRRLCAFLLVMGGCFGLDAAESVVSDVRFQQHWPWNGLVDIHFTVGGAEAEAKTFKVSFNGYDNDLERWVKVSSVTGIGWDVSKPVQPGSYRAVWDAEKDLLEPGKAVPVFSSSSFQIQVTATMATEADQEDYLVIDLSKVTGDDTYRISSASGLSSDNWLHSRTDQIWLRRVEPQKSFLMGSPSTEVPREENEKQHPVNLTSPYYIGVYEITQRQWELVMGTRPSKYLGDTRPVESVSYNMIRGGASKANWPAQGHQVADDSFIGRLQKRTGLTLDLPTEAHWEHACRAGTTTQLNSGIDFKIIERFRYYNNDTCLVYDMEEDALPITNFNLDALSALARWGYNTDDGKGGKYAQHTEVGSYLGNNWNLYDMHGNVSEWCLDWYESFHSNEVVTNPVGPWTGTHRVCRGSSWQGDKKDIDKSRAAWRSKHPSDYTSPGLGLRIVWYKPDAK